MMFLMSIRQKQFAVKYPDMKRNEFVRHLLAEGCVLHRHGARHDIYPNPSTGDKQPVTRHTEIDNRFGKAYSEKPGTEGQHKLTCSRWRHSLPFAHPTYIEEQYHARCENC